MEEVRINKYLAACGVCSRRDADLLISQGAVTVNGAAAVTGMRRVAGVRKSAAGMPITSDIRLLSSVSLMSMAKSLLFFMPSIKYSPSSFFLSSN